MADTIKILTLDNEFEARLLKELLDENRIPYILRSYHDSAYDGLWQTRSCWGHVEAPEQYRSTIIGLYNEMSKPGNIDFNV